MPKRKLLIALTVAGLFVAAFGSSTMSASADQRTCLVTTVAGQQITITAPACTVDQVAAQVPGAIASVQDVTAPTPTNPPPAPAPPVTIDAQTAPSQGGSGSGTGSTSSNSTPAPTQEPQASKQDP